MSIANEQAFPLVVNDGEQKMPGLTIRQHFAIHAAQGLLAHGAMYPSSTDKCEGLADMAVAVADALIAKLEVTA